MKIKNKTFLFFGNIILYLKNIKKIVKNANSFTQMEKNMWISNIKLSNFRNYDKKEIKLNKNINVFFRRKCSRKNKYN